MSWTFESYENKNIYTEYRWDKNNGYEVIIGRKVDGVVRTITRKQYATEGKAKRSFEKNVKKLKKGIDM